jgi:hypothetical protein
VDRPCRGLNFHAFLTERDVSIELRPGTHLASSEAVEPLVAMVFDSSVMGWWIGKVGGLATRGRRCNTRIDVLMEWSILHVEIAFTLWMRALDLYRGR